MKALLRKIRQILRDKRTRKTLTRIISSISAIVVFVTTYALILPAITMEKEADCGIEAHQHDDSCYEERLICDLPETEAHYHTDACYDIQTILTCTIPEHQHSYEEGCYDDEGNLICELAEHVHDEACYEEQSELVCGLEETEGHVHDESCYEKVLICGKEEHIHGKECYDVSGQAQTEQVSGVSSTAATAYSEENTVEDSPHEEIDVEPFSANPEEDAPVLVSEEDLSSLSSDEASDQDQYIPELAPLYFPAVLNGNTDVYYYEAAEDEVIEDSTQLTEWKKVKSDTELGEYDLLRIWLSYTIPSGSLNETNATARYRLPSNLHLTDEQCEAINKNVNGFASQFADYNTLEVTDPDSYQNYLGIEAVEGTRRPSDDIEEYLRKHDGEEYISATVRAEDIFDEEGLYGEKGAYLGTDLVFTFTPYTVAKNRHEYDSNGQPTKAGEKVTGWLSLDFNMDQVDWDEVNTEQVEAEDQDQAASDSEEEASNVNPEQAAPVNAIATVEKTAEIVFAEEDPEQDIDQISTSIRMITGTESEEDEEGSAEAAMDEAGSQDGEEAPEDIPDEVGGEDTQSDQDEEPEEEAVNYPAVTFDDSITMTAGTLSSDVSSQGENAGIPSETELVVHVEAEEGTFPEGTSMQLGAVENMDEVASAVENVVEGQTLGFHAVDITFRNADGEIIEPLKPVRVNITSEAIRKAVENDSTAALVVHVEDQAKAEEEAAAGKQEDTEDQAASMDSETVSSPDTPDEILDTLSFEAESFSVYAVVYTVDFHYEINGKTYEFSIPGGGFVSLEHMVEALGIADQTGRNETEEENDGSVEAANHTVAEAIDLNKVPVSKATKTFVADVADVEFSSPDLVWTGKADAETTVGSLKETNGLEVQYSAELTEEQIAEINAQTVEAGDWALISMQPFTSEETLTVTMKNGDQFVIRVTDVQLPETVTGDLLAYFSFDEYHREDSSGNNAKAEYGPGGSSMTENPYYPIQEGVHGNGFYFNPAYDYGAYYLRITDSEGGSLLDDHTEATISFWAKPVGQNNPNWAFFIADNEAQRSEGHLNYLGYFDTNGNVNVERYAVGRNGNNFVVNGAAPLGEWHYITVTHSADTMILYIDGAEVQRKTGVPSLQQVLGNNSFFQIGRANWGNGEYYNGYIDELAVFGRALTADEVDALYHDTYEADELTKNSNRAFKIKVNDMDGGDSVIIYNRVWNEETNRFDDYAIDGNGNLVPVRDSGDSIYWKGDPSLQWVLTVHKTGEEENGYYEFFNPVTGKYLCPQSDSLFSDEPLGINLPGRGDEDRYGSLIEKWDDTMTAYYGYKYENEQLVTASSNGSENNRDWEFYFAKPDVAMPEGRLETVDTLNNPSGLTMKLFDYNLGTEYRQRLSYMTSVLGHTTYQPGVTQGILPNYFEGDFPIANNDNGINYNPNLVNLFAPNGGYSIGGVVDNLFIQSIYDETGYYEYSAFDNYAYLDSDHDGDGITDFNVYKQIGTPAPNNRADVKSFYYERGNFLPYNAIDENHLSINKNLFDEFGNALPPSDPRYGEDLYLSPNTIDYFFGMSIDAHFEMPKNGIDKRGNPVTYEFNGDDDMWIYIDGVLVLDLGGVHDAREGTINFKTGQIIYAYEDETEPFDPVTLTGCPKTIRDCFKKAGHYPDGTPWPADDDSLESNYFDGDTFKDFSTHTMNMFYLERGAGASNLHMRFNLPIIEPGSFSVEKKLENANGDYANRKFAYQVYRGDGAIINPETDSNITCVYAGTDPVEVVDFDDEGVFYLKPGEKAVFSGLSQTTEYYVRELNVDSEEFSVEINDQPAAIQAGTVESPSDTVGNRSHLEFKNREKKPGSLLLTKIVEGENPKPDATFEFYIYLESTSGDIVPYGNGVYYVKKGDVYYEYTADGLVPASNQAEPPYYKAGPNGAINNIPDGFSIEVKNLLPGTHFLVEERLNTMPPGFLFKEKQLAADTYAPTTSTSTYNNKTADGKIIQSVTAQARVINNYESVDVPVDKNWDDFDEEGADWSVTLRLQWAPIYEGETEASADFTDVTPVKEITITKAMMAQGADSLIQRTFGDLPKYGYDADGVQYRIQYSVEEMAYTATKGGVTYTFVRSTTPGQPDVYTPEGSENQFAAVYPHDAGELSEEDGDYFITVSNHPRISKNERYIDFELMKTWSEEGITDRDDTYATLKLLRNTRQEFRDTSHMNPQDKEADPITVRLVDTDGKEYDKIEVQPHTGIRISVTRKGKTGDSTYTVNGGDFEPNNPSYPGNNVYFNYNPDKQTKDFDGRAYPASSCDITISGDLEYIDSARLSDTTSGGSQTETSILVEEFTLNKGNHWAKEFYLLREKTIAENPSAGNETVEVYEYYLEEIDSNPEGFAAGFFNYGTDIADGDRYNPIISGDQTIEARNEPEPKLIVKKQWRGVPDTTGYVTTYFTLYQGREGVDNIGNAHVYEGQEYPYDGAPDKRYYNIPLSSSSDPEHDYTWVCPEILPARDQNGNRLAYFVVESPGQGNISGTSWELYGYSQGPDPETGNYIKITNPDQPTGAQVVGNDGTLMIHNKVRRYHEMDVKKQYFMVEEAGSVFNVTADLTQNIILGFKVIRRVVSKDGNTMITGWQDYGDEMLVGYDEDQQPVESNGQNDFHLQYAGLWHWTIHEQGGNLNSEHVGLPLEGYYTDPATGNTIAVNYQYSFRETRVYKDLDRTPYPDWDWFSTIVPDRYMNQNGGQVTGEFGIRFPDQDGERVANYHASDLKITKRWLGQPDAEEVYIKLWRKAGENSEPEDVTEIIAKDAAGDYPENHPAHGNANWQGYVEDPEIVDTQNNWLVLKSNSDGVWDTSVTIHNLLTNSMITEGQYTYYIEEVGYKDKEGNQHFNVPVEGSDEEDLSELETRYTRWVGGLNGQWEAALSSSGAEKDITLGGVGENRLMVMNVPEMDLAAEKSWVDENGDPRNAWFDSITFQIEQVSTRYDVNGAATGETKRSLVKIDGNDTFTMYKTGVNAHWIVKVDHGQHDQYTVDRDDSRTNDSGDSWTFYVDGLQEGYFDENNSEWHCVYNIKELAVPKSEVTINGNGVSTSDKTVEIENKYTETSAVQITKVFRGIDALPESFRITASWTDLHGEHAIDLTTSGGQPENVTLSGDGSAGNPYVWTISRIPVQTEPVVVTFTESGFDAEDEVHEVKVTSTTDPQVSNENPVTTVTVSDTVINRGNFTNTYGSNEVDLKIAKKDENGDPLPGAVFQMKRKTGSVYAKFVNEAFGLEDGVRQGPFEVTGGEIIIPKLEDGEYLLSEIDAPEGYVIAEASEIYFTISDGQVTYTNSSGEPIENQRTDLVEYKPDDKTFEITNEPGAALPSTGGPGTRIFTILGSVLFFGAAVLLCRRRGAD